MKAAFPLADPSISGQLPVCRQTEHLVFGRFHFYGNGVSQDLAKPCCPDSCWLCFERPALRHQLWLKHKQRTRLHHFALRLEFFTEIVAIAPGQHCHNLSIGRAPISALRCDDRRCYLAGLDLPFALSNFIRKRSARTMWGQVPMVRGCTELRSGTCRLRGDRGLSYSQTPAMASPAEGPH
jgi:hypothetical protein